MAFGPAWCAPTDRDNRIRVAFFCFVELPLDIRKGKLATLLFDRIPRNGEAEVADSKVVKQCGEYRAWVVAEVFGIRCGKGHSKTRCWCRQEESFDYGCAPDDTKESE